MNPSQGITPPSSEQPFEDAPVHSPSGDASKGLPGPEKTEPARPEATLEPGKVYFLNPHDLRMHPRLARFPALNPAEYERLRASIGELGILDPLKSYARRELADGRHRLKVALELRLPTVPVLIVRDSIDPALFALAASVDGRQCTKSKIALLVFEQHPELLKDQEVRKKQGLRQGPAGDELKSEKSRDQDDLPSYRKFAKRYGVPHHYFSRLNEMKGSLSEEKWLELSNTILAGEIEIESAYSKFDIRRREDKRQQRKPQDKFESVHKAFTHDLWTFALFLVHPRSSCLEL